MINKKNLKNNIVEADLVTMINNGDTIYNASPCVVMNNLVKNHNNIVDEMCTSQHSNIRENHESQINFKNTTSSLMSPTSSPVDIQDEVKTFNNPVDYETAFSDYYPKNKKNQPNKDDDENYSDTYPHRPENKLNINNLN